MFMVQNPPKYDDVICEQPLNFDATHYTIGKLTFQLPGENFNKGEETICPIALLYCHLLVDSNCSRMIDFRL